MPDDDVYIIGVDGDVYMDPIPDFDMDQLCEGINQNKIDYHAVRKGGAALPEGVFFYPDERQFRFNSNNFAQEGLLDMQVIGRIDYFIVPTECEMEEMTLETVVKKENNDKSSKEEENLPSKCYHSHDHTGCPTKSNKKAKKGKKGKGRRRRDLRKEDSDDKKAYAMHRDDDERTASDDSELEHLEARRQLKKNKNKKEDSKCQHTHSWDHTGCGDGDETESKQRNENSKCDHSHSWDHTGCKPKDKCD